MAPLLILLLAPLTWGQDAKAENAMLQGILRNLLSYTRNIKETSTLETVKDLELQPPYEGKIILDYNPKFEAVSLECPGTAVSGCATAVAGTCLWQKDPNGLIGAGSAMWNLSTVDGKPSADRAAFILAHEIGHVRLKHTEQGILFYDKAFKKWHALKGKDIAKRFLQQEESRYKTITADDREMIDFAVQTRVSDVFEQQSGDVLARYSEKMEAEADEYAYKLSAAAGYSPEKAHGIFLAREANNLLFGHPNDAQCKAEREENPPRHAHPNPNARDQRIFDKYYLQGL